MQQFSGVACLTRRKDEQVFSKQQHTPGEDYFEKAETNQP